jgi:hypothetical protein
VPSSSPHETKPALEQPSTPAQPPVALEPQKKAEAAVAPARIVPQSLLATYPTLVGLDLNVLYLVDHEAGTVLLKFLPTEQIEDKP